MRLLAAVLAVIASTSTAALGVQAPPPWRDSPELRALWVDAFHAGIRSPKEVDQLVEAAQRANLNTLFVQVRRRGDALYTKGPEPPLDDPAYDPAFDALAYVTERAHRAGLRVHAWLNAMPVWRDEAPPKDARHVFNQHGPAVAADGNWLTASPTGEQKFPVGYFLDAGHPAAAAYVADLYVNVVRQYAVDGIHFDYIRYPETEERLPRGAAVGYNAVSLARFRRSTGRTDVPLPGDEEWSVWRRRQVSDLVRRVSIEAKAVNPRIVISAAVIPWGVPPRSERDFADVAPMQRVFQDWHQWLRDGLLDLAVPMNYARETDDRVRQWFDGWIRWEKQHKHGRQLAIGLGAYLNTPDNLLAQISRARAPDRGRQADGVSFFSYATPTLPPAPGTDLAFLSSGLSGTPRPFAQPASPPAMPWIDQPERGWIAGIVSAPRPELADGVVVKVKRTGFAVFRRASRVRTDGNGFFGLTNLSPGRYRVWLESARDHSSDIEVVVEAGKVARAIVPATSAR
jgi:uncharacterized lipoprotein YddW (UPF0748 family)